MYDCRVQYAPLTYKFTGKERDSESALDNFEARYLGSSLGRFMSSDPPGGHPLKIPQTLNRYAYVRNNPTTLTDPTGLDFYLRCSGGDPSKSTAWNLNTPGSDHSIGKSTGRRGASP